MLTQNGGCFEIVDGFGAQMASEKSKKTGMLQKEIATKTEKS